jgi:hypothetical protein
MTCAEVAPLLDEYIDGSLPADTARSVDAHLAGCDRCRAEVAGLRALVAEARALPRSVLPGRELWTGIEPRLGGEPRGSSAARSLLVRARPLLRLAAALFLLLAGATLATLYQRRHAPQTGFALEQRRYAEATADLARKLADDPTNLSASTRAVVGRNLAIVDQAIREAEAALATDPGNTALEQMVLARYAQRLDLLKRATAAGRQES